MALRSSSVQAFQLLTPLLQWLDYSFGRREKPLASPQVAMSQDPGGLRFEVKSEPFQKGGVRRPGVNTTEQPGRTRSDVNPPESLAGRQRQSDSHGATSTI